MAMVAAALAAGAAGGVKDTAKQAVADSYAALKGLITRRYGVLEADVVAVENDPEEPLRRQLLAKQLHKVGAGDDLEVRAAAEKLLRIIAEHAPAAAEAVGVKLTRVEAGGDIEVSDFFGSAQRVLDATDVNVGGSIRIGRVRAGGTDEDPSAARG
jgi:hypothetical protein